MNSGNGPERTPRSRQKGQLLFDWSKSGDAPVPPPLPQPDVHESATGAPDGHEISPALSYPPGHPWHYYRLGDNAAPMPVDAIPPAKGIEHTLDRELPKRGPKGRIPQLRQGSPSR